MSQTVKWGKYNLTVCDISANWSNAPGVYIFTGLKDGHWRPYYIGKTESFAARMPNHERWADAARTGATHVHAMVVTTATERTTIEKELIGIFQPALNNNYR